ncbi:DMT family transporter [Pseudonocardia sp. GCM10023141]|uniref:DMT family transporter n=1 Tax=Pseudonocardia sp. GCM10023141 TaxID=3252653 RepID=UPI00360E6A31
MSLSPSRTAARPLSGVPFLVVAGLLWGTGGLFGRLLAEQSGMSSIAVATFRLGVGGLLICGYLLATGRRVPATAAAWRRVAVIGALAALFQGCYFAVVTLTTVSTATLVTIGSAPVLVLLAERLTGRGRPGVRSVLAVGLALAGLALLVGLPSDGAGNVVAGALLAVVSGAGFAAMTLVSARPVPGLDAPTCTGVAFVLGGALLVPVGLIASPAGLGFAVSPASVALLLALGIVPTALAYSAFFRGLRTAPARVGALLALLEPLTAAVLAALLLGDRLGATGIVGAALLGVAVVLGSAHQPRGRGGADQPRGRGGADQPRGRGGADQPRERSA